MRKISEEFNSENCIQNIRKIFEIEDLDEIPHWNTINNFLKMLDYTETEKIIKRLLVRLILMRSFESSRIRSKYWQVTIDGTGLFNFKEKHCENCLTRKYRDDDGNIKRIDYYHYVLEAKLILFDNIVISFATEFVENEKQDVEKQDCELRAFYRLEEKIKKSYPRLPICLTMDSLYACAPVFEICEKNRWKYIIRLKDGSIPSVAEEFHNLKRLEHGNEIIKKDKDKTRIYKFTNGIMYSDHSLNIGELTIKYLNNEKKKDIIYVFISNFPISNKNCEKFIEDGRRRWRIENEGFNIQINNGYYLEHEFSKNYNAMKNHYFLIQIAHMISQLLERYIEIVRIGKISISNFHRLIKENFQYQSISDGDLEVISGRFQIRFG